MKLLFDQNLSPRLVGNLADLFPDSLHVQSAALETAEDDALWDFAGAGSFSIVTKDEDFSEMSLLRGFPPKVIWLQLGNCTTDEVADALRRNHGDIQVFIRDSNASVFVVRHL